MLVGAVGTGKTTLTQKLHGSDIVYSKTQAVEYGTNVIDTPGEFTQRRQYYSALQVTAAKADVIGLLQSIGESFDTYPPGFTSMFSKPSVGIITKIDLAESEDDILKVELALKKAGATQIFRLSSVNDEGVDALLDYLNKEDE